MYGLPPETDLSFLKGKEFTQVAIGPYDVQFKFADGGLIQIESSYVYRRASDGQLIKADRCRVSSTDSGRPFDYASASAQTFPLLLVPITEVTWRSDGTLTLSFANGDQLEIYDDDSRHEAYHVIAGAYHLIV